MIQFNNVSPDLTSSATNSIGSSTSSSSDASFESALSDAINQTLQNFGMDPNSVNVTVAPSVAAPSQAEDSQASVSAPTTPANAAPTSIAASLLAPFINAPSTVSSSGTASTSPSVTQATTASQSSTATSTDTQPALDATQSFDQSYWAAQPAAVQALENISDPSERTQMATQLANEGYTIDVPIMVNGWDPSAVTSLRESYGYTWVPSALQNPIESAPGVNNPGVQSYDPNNPPPGSITV